MMAPSVRHKSPMKQQQRGGSPDLDSPRRRSSPRRERSSPARRRTSPRTTTNSSHRGARSPARDNEKPSSSRGGRSSKSERSNSPPTSQSPSPRTKRLRRAQGERELVDREPPTKRNNSNREGDKERHREKGGGHRDDEHNERRRSARETNDGGGGSSRSRHRRSISPMDRGHKNRHSSHSPHRSSRSRAHEEEVEVPNPRRADHHEDGDDDSVAKMKAAEEALEAKKQKPSFELSGKLADETNRVKGVTLLFTEPPEARKPDVRWRLYVFKAGEVLNEPLYIHRQSCYLFGRERRVADIPTDHPSCSKQHAVIQFRQIEKERPDGMLRKQVGPYLMDLGSTNGTFINDNRVEPQRYYELFEKDTIKFGNSSREYVILHENSGGE